MKKRYIEHPLVRTFFTRQNAEVRAEYARSVAALEAYGFLTAPMGEKVEAGLFAIRIRKGGNVRVFYSI